MSELRLENCMWFGPLDFDWNVATVRGIVDEIKASGQALPPRLVEWEQKQVDIACWRAGLAVALAIKAARGITPPEPQ